MNIFKDYRSLVAVFIFTNISGAEAGCTLSQLHWLEGEWQARQGQSTVVERWQKTSANTFEGEGQTLSAAGQLQQQESLRLVDMQQDIFYLAKVKHNPLPVAFKLEECAPERLTFVNPAHDFPKQLVYQLRPTAAHSTQTPQLEVLVSDGAGKGFKLLFVKK